MIYKQKHFPRAAFGTQSSHKIFKIRYMVANTFDNIYF